jgi:addiction module RelE/StbE family toxin
MRIQRSKRFDKEFRKQQIKVQDKFAERILLFAKEPSNPLLNIHGLTGEYRGCFSFNVSADIRVVYEVRGDVVSLIAIGTHAQLYG